MKIPTFWSGRRVLLTGHTGFKGSWLLLWLRQLGAEVCGFALPADPKLSLFHQLSFHLDTNDDQGWLHNEGDLRDIEHLRKVVQRFQPDVVIHLAAQPLVRRSYINPLETWSTNVLGTLNLLEALRPSQHLCAVVIVTTDKVYLNQEWTYGYRENDSLGGHDPYSASKAALEIAVSSWRSSFCGTALHQTPYLKIATARAGNVIGGGDWAADRIVPDAIRALMKGEKIPLRNPSSTRPWQHVLDPLSGYLRLAESLTMDPSTPCDSFNFGPHLQSNCSVENLIDSLLLHWPGDSVCIRNANQPHEAGLLHLNIDKAYHRLGWEPCWDFDTTISRTVNWYRSVHEGVSPLELCNSDLKAYQSSLR